MRLIDGKCAGRVEIKYEGSWKWVRDKDWTDTNSNTVCRQLNCGGARALGQNQLSQEQNNFLIKPVTCQPNAVHISECISKDSLIPSTNLNAVTIICEGECGPYVFILTFRFLSLCSNSLLNKYVS